MRWLLFLDYFEQRVGKPKRHRSVSPFGIDARVFGERKVGAVDERVGIEEEKFFGRIGHILRIGSLAKNN